MFSQPIEIRDSPKLKANIFSILSFHYLQPLFTFGAKETILEKDLWNPTPKNKGHT